ncbi:MAG: glycosyltransferase [Coriobacteriia bacterium]|nr:glycosyltransferase [Coriobacteriia bacterium]
MVTSQFPHFIPERSAQHDVEGSCTLQVATSKMWQNSSLSILVIPTWYPSSDDPVAGIFIRNQAIALAQTGIDVAVLAVTQEGQPSSPVITSEDGVRVVRASLGRTTGTLGRLKYYLQWFSALQKLQMKAYRKLQATGFQPDIVHVHTLWPAARAVSVLGEETPFMVTEHSEEYLVGTERKLLKVPGILPIVLRPLARRAAAYIVPSRSLTNSLKELRMHHSIQIVPNVVPSRDIVMSYPIEAVKNILHVSQFGEAKNIPLLLHALKQVRSGRSDFVLHLVGDGDNRSLIEQMVHDLELQDCVKFHGSCTSAQINSLLDQTAFSVISSRHETFSVFGAESLMAGRPVLSTRCGGLEDYIGAEQGLLVTNNNEQALVDGIVWMLDNYQSFDPQLLNDYAREHFAPEVVAKQLIGLYNQALGLQA